MEVGELISFYRKQAGMTIDELAVKSGVPKGTLNKIIGGVTKAPTLDNMKSIAKALGKNLADFDDAPSAAKKSSSEVPAYKGKTPSLSDEAMKVAKRYHALDIYGKAAVQAVMGEEEARIKDQAELDLIITKPEPKIIPLYWSPAAAGIAAPILGDDYDHYELKPEDPQGAVFAIRVQGDSMEPHFPDGSIAFCNKDPLQDGDIGVFCLDGDSFIKQYHYDKMMGMTYLFSLNRDRADADKLITRTGGQTLTCFGRVMTRRRFPVPGAGGI